MINPFQAQESSASMLVKDISPVQLPIQIQLQKQRTESSDDINVQNIKHVDSSSGYQQQQQLHLGIISQEWRKSEQNEAELNMIHQKQEQEIQNAQINLIVLGQAVAERKSINFKSISGYMQAHIKYYSRHMDVLIDLETQIVNRLTKQREFIKQVYSHFYSLNQIQMQSISLSGSYSFLSHHVFLEEQKKSTYQKIVDALKNIMIARNQFQINSGSSSSWVSTQVLVYLNQLIVIHQNNLSFYSHQILKYKLQADQKLKLMNVLFKQIENMIVFGTAGKDIDLLSQEIKYFSVAEEIKGIMVEWGNVVNGLWLTSQKGEINIVNEIKKYIDELFESIGGLLEKNEKLIKAQEYWVGFNIEEEMKFCYHINFILNEQNQSMIRKHLGKGSLKNQDFQRFVRLEHEKQWIGNPSQIKSFLILKKFSCKLIVNKNKTENLMLYSSIDGFVVFAGLETGALINSMNLKHTVSNRLSHHIVQIKEKKAGFFRDSWNKAELQFGSSDQAQEFLVFLAQSMQEIEGIIS